MPCEGPDRWEVEGEMQREIDRATRAACAALRKLEDLGKSIPPGAHDWWEEHKKLDAEREAEEERVEKEKTLRAKAIRKLSREERKVLGV